MQMIKRVCVWGGALIVVWTATVAPLSATVAPDVPEINAGSMSAGIALLAGGVLMLRAWRSRK